MASLTQRSKTSSTPKSRSQSKTRRKHCLTSNSRCSAKGAATEERGTPPLFASTHPLGRFNANIPSWSRNRLLRKIPENFLQTDIVYPLHPPIFSSHKGIEHKKLFFDVSNHRQPYQHFRILATFARGVAPY